MTRMTPASRRHAQMSYIQCYGDDDDDDDGRQARDFCASTVIRVGIKRGESLRKSLRKNNFFY